MLRIRKVADATTAPNRAAIEAAQKIMREFSAMPDYDIAKLPEQLSNPLKHRFVSRLFVAENARDQTLGVALCSTRRISASPISRSSRPRLAARGGASAPRSMSGCARRPRARHPALFREPPDDPALSPDPAIRANNANRLKFYERYGARPIVNTAYETPVTPGTTDPPYLVLDPLGSNDLPSRDTVKKVVRAILERKYGLLQAYVQMVVQSIADDPIRLREPRYTKRPQRRRSARQASRASRSWSPTTTPSTTCKTGLCRGAGAHPLHHGRAQRLGAVREGADQALFRPAYPRRA